MTLIAWRTALGGVDARQNAESTMLLEFPYWSLFPFAVFCLCLLVAICFYTFWCTVSEARAGRGESP